MWVSSVTGSSEVILRGEGGKSVRMCRTAPGRSTRVKLLCLKLIKQLGAPSMGSVVHNDKDCQLKERCAAKTDAVDFDAGLCI